MKKTVIELIKNASYKYEKAHFVYEKEDYGYVGKTFYEIHNEAISLASELLELGLQKNDKVALLSEGRVNWIISEFGAILAGCIAVPLSVRLLPSEILFRINHSESKAIFISKNNIDKLFPILDKIECKDFKIFYLDDETLSISEQLQKFKIQEKKGIFILRELLIQGRKSRKNNESKLLEIMDNCKESDVVTISYTSGTTGNPKGIMLTHLNYWSNTTDALTHFRVPEKKRMMIVLPLDHSFAHTVGIYASLIRGFSIYFLDSRGGTLAALKNITVNLKEANPEFMLTVPAITSNFMNKIIDGIQAKGSIIRFIFYWGLNAGKKLFGNGYAKAGFWNRLMNRFPYFLANKLIFCKLRKIFGSSLEFCVGGGALLDIHQQKFFYTIGIPVFQGYGLTEATPIISANTPEIHKLGTSGKIIPNLVCKILKTDGNIAGVGEKGEIVVKGNNVMAGYYKNVEASKEALNDGWLFTGDLGYFDEDGFLVVIGREKALLISQDGEKYSPEEIEEAIQNTSSLISQIMLYNDHCRFTTALITLNDERTVKLIKDNRIKTPEELLKQIHKSLFEFKNSRDFKDKFQDKWLPSSFQIAEINFSEQNGMVNSTLKIVRHKIIEFFKEKFDFMQSSEGSNYMNKMNLDALARFFKK